MARRRKPPRSGAITELPPLRIAGQIAALQGIYYAVALVLMLFMALVSGTGFSLDLVFGWGSLRGDTTQGWLVGFVWLCCAGAVVVALVALIARSKLIPDFALTLHVIHLVVVYFYTGLLPRFWMWWVTMGVSSAATVVLGMWGCRWRELRPISFGGNRPSNDPGASTENGPADGGEDVGDAEMGFGRGRGRGRGRDGAGEYEMVGMKPDDR
ncbi:integral membrane protein S linking to the trans Golgi network-domain-containing protein [Truncatella angustata]|uniref:Integral membrane protein S linking to the trans Golgi network-domain-containing protein n=1 Tax=Truncatella angustata TaxID=152316 RepID=A0A9P8RJM3_9PEZI|nr:integral membrane protein S linking to the trans Golgi network-domain-containing protein [Truncatella angustata]KAH6647274.1 integral membrane protein S linking to the trans Golgi network-domain-containing protein [Truncatella angustata]